MKKKPLIGIVAPLLARDHLRDAVRGAIRQAEECGCDVIVLSPLITFTQSNALHAQAEKLIYQFIRAGEFDGFLYLRDETLMDTALIAEIETLLSQSGRYVMQVDEQEHPVFDSTQYDDYYDFRKVVEHLVQVHGYRRIYCLTGPKHLFQAQTRLRAFLDAMEKYGLAHDESTYTYGTFWTDAAQQYAKRLISGELPMPEAVVCGNDIMAYALIGCLQNAGIRVPEDVAVTGYDGFRTSFTSDVTLTTYLRDHFQLGADAMRRLYRNITGSLVRKVKRENDGFLIGSSCGCRMVPTEKSALYASAERPKDWIDMTFSDDMGIDLAQSQNQKELLIRALYHDYLLYDVEQAGIFLTDDFRASSPEDSTLRLTASYTKKNGPQLDDGPEFPPSMLHQYFLSEDTSARVVFLSPLHLHAQYLGLISVSFGRETCLYDRYYPRFVSTLETAMIYLDNSLSQRAKSSKSENSIRIRQRDRIRNKLCLLRENMKEHPEAHWTIEEMCRLTQISKSTLQKNYKTFFGVSIFEDLILLRIAKAQRLLTETELSLLEISEQCGYSSDNYFMKQFRKIMGMTPTEYRWTQQENPKSRNMKTKA